jgi:phage virion morphogenesis protein
MPSELANELAPLEAWCSELIARLEPGQRRKLSQEIARRLRETQAKRIAGQTNPDGSPYEPRKPRLLDKKKGRIRRAMFAKLRTAKWLKTKATPNSALVYFAGKVGRIAMVHQFGLKDRVNKNSSLEVQYPVRELLGFTEAEVQTIADQVLKHIAV